MGTDAWVAQLVEGLTPDFGSGHELTVCEIEAHVRLCADSAEAAGIIYLSLSLCPPLFMSAHSLSLSKYITKHEKIKKQ